MLFLVNEFQQAGRSPAKVQLILNQWMQFFEKFEKNNVTRYTFYHESYRDLSIANDSSSGLWYGRRMN